MFGVVLHTSISAGALQTCSISRTRAALLWRWATSLVAVSCISRAAARARHARATAPAQSVSQTRTRRDAIYRRLRHHCSLVCVRSSFCLIGFAGGCVSHIGLLHYACRGGCASLGSACRYKTTVGDTPCVPCASAGGYAMTTHGALGATSALKCLCPVGTYFGGGASDAAAWRAGGWACRPCPLGAPMSCVTVFARRGAASGRCDVVGLEPPANHHTC